MQSFRLFQSSASSSSSSSSTSVATQAAADLLKNFIRFCSDKNNLFKEIDFRGFTNEQIINMTKDSLRELQSLFSNLTDVPQAEVNNYNETLFAGLKILVQHNDAVALNEFISQGDEIANFIKGNQYVTARKLIDHYVVLASRFPSVVMVMSRSYGA